MFSFSGNPLDRAAERRGDTGWLAAKWRDPGSRVLPLWRLKPLFRGKESDEGPLEPGFVGPKVVGLAAAADADPVFLGLEGDRAVFAIAVAGDADPALEGPLAGLGHFRELRAAALSGVADEGALAIMAEAKALIDWHCRHRFCANCGTPTEAGDGGWRRHCSACDADHFPRTDPVVIMLATDGEECLVGRAARFPQGMVSALAGFVEPGESIEEAVRREIREETGVRVSAVRYYASQPWPFPSSLMIGCFATAKSRAITLADNELVEAFWLDKRTVRALLAGETIEGLSIPKPYAIAHHLFRAWAAG